MARISRVAAAWLGVSPRRDGASGLVRTRARAFLPTWDKLPLPMGWLKNRKRKSLREQPVPDSWREIIERRVPLVRTLSTSEQEQLFGHMHVFLAEKHFEGAGGMTIDDEVRVTIAAQACILLLHRDTDYFPHCDSIIVYPQAFVVDVKHTDEFGIVSEGHDVRLGESSHDGLVVLAWDDVLRGAYNTSDGYNVVLHEFAHQLDEESGMADGVPKLETRAAHSAFAQVIYDEFNELVEATRAREATDIDGYGATHPAEFFAVITETFFERPFVLRTHHSDLYQRLREFYRQDPAARLEAAPPPILAREGPPPSGWLTSLRRRRPR